MLGKINGYILLPFISILLLLQGCINFSFDNNYFSFETDMEGWEARGIDLDSPSVDWSINRSDTMAFDGNISVEFYLENFNDAGKIWIEREFEVKTRRTYEVKIEYAFASSDFGSFNLWRIITGVVEKSPETRDDLIFQDDTGNGYDNDVGYVWLNKSYSFTIKSTSNGKLYVILGIWGTWETPRTYYLDNVHITFTRKTDSMAKYYFMELFSEKLKEHHFF
jgi:hypothetical protein